MHLLWVSPLGWLYLPDYFKFYFIDILEIRIRMDYKSYKV